MSVRITLSRGRDELCRISGGLALSLGRPFSDKRPSVGDALRSRFGFSLIHAPLFKRARVDFSELAMPGQRSYVDIGGSEFSCYR